MKLHCFAGVEYNNKIYFSALNMNAFCELDLLTKQISILKLFDKEPLNSRLHRSAFLYKDQAWFIPQEGKFIVCVDLTNFNMTYYEVPYRYMNPVKKKRIFTVYSGGMVYEEKYLCLIPYDVDAVTVIDMEKHVITPYYGINTEDNKKTVGAVYDNNCLTVLFDNAESCKRIFLQSGEVEKLPWCEGEECISVSAEGQKVWFAARTPRYIVEYNLKTCAKQKILCEQSQDQYSEVVDLGSKLVFLPLSAANFLILDKKDKTVVKETFGHEEIFSSKLNKVMPIGSEHGKYISMGVTGNVVRFLGERIDIYSLNMDDTVFAESYFSLVKEDGRMAELCQSYHEGDMELKDNVSFLIRLLEYADRKEETKHQVCSGKKIWDMIKG